jgi:hypothetical protein
MTNHLYNRKGFSDVGRGSIIRWAGNTPQTALTCFFCTNKGAFQEAIERRGFTVVDIENYGDTEGLWGGNWYIVTAIVPASGSLEGAGTYITAAAYEVFGDVSSVQVVDATPTSIPNAPPPPPTPVPLPNADPCASKTGLDWLTCKLGVGAQPATTNQNNPNKPPVPDPCASKNGLDWLACKLGFESLAQQWGFGVGAGATLVLATFAILGLVILKK